MRLPGGLQRRKVNLKYEKKLMNTRTINPVQLHLLEMFNYCRSEQTISEMKDVLADFYAKKVQKEADRLWDEGTLNNEAIEQILQEHWRTPY